MEDIRENGRVLNNSIQHITPEAVKGSRLFPKNSIIIATSATIGEHALITVPFLSNQRFTSLSLKSDINNHLDIKFVFYYSFILAEWCCNNTTTSSFASVDMNGFKKIQIPIPPLAIQKEIVKILDTFTRLEAELEAELEARNKQYEYYRDELLSFGDDVEWKALGEVGKVSMCKRIFKNQTSTTGQIPFYKIGTFGNTPNAFISQEIYDEYRRKFSFPKKGDVLFSASGTIGRRVIYDGEPAYFQDSNIVWIDNDESKVLNKFLYYLYSIVIWQTEGGTIKRLYNDNLKKIQIPIPPLPIQKEIVSILDKFDALVNDISIGLPAEIAARQKQYEYYRNQLLTFKPVGADNQRINHEI